MSEQTSEPEPTAGQRIEQFIAAVDRALNDGGMGADERQNVVADLRVQIEEMLSARATATGKAVSLADVEAVLAELDPPESYLEAGQTREAPRAEEASHGCGHGRRHRAGPRWFWKKRRIAEAVRQAIHSFSPFGHPMFAGMTARARDSITLAKSEAQRMRHDFIGTEHLLLGLILEGTGVAAGALAELGVDIERARVEAARLVVPGTAATPQPYLPLTPRLRQAIEQARFESRNFGHDYVGTEHLLLGVLDIPAVAPQILVNLGLTTAQVREEVVRRIGSPAHSVHASVTYWPAGAAQRYKIGGNEFRVVAGGGDTGGVYAGIELAVVAVDGLGMRKHSREDISVHVLEGGVRLRVEDRVIEMSEGDFCRIPRGTRHEIQPGVQSARAMLTATPAGLEKFMVAMSQAEGNDAIRDVAAQFGVTIE